MPHRPILDLLRLSEFLAAIGGAVVGGLIAYLVQIKALREARRDRAEERLLVKKGTGELTYVQDVPHPSQSADRSSAYFGWAHEWG